MRGKKQSGASLTLIELMITIAFFALTMAVFVQVFAMSYRKKETARNLFEAQRIVSCAAEVLEGDDTEEMRVSFPQMYTKAQNKQIAGYDENWKAVDEKDARWFLVISRDGGRPMEEVHLSVGEPGEDAIYELTLDLYIPGEKEGGAE